MDNIEFGCIGRTLTHSYSVAVHAALADYDYRLIPLEPEALEPFMREKAFRGINVTIPYKQAVIPFLDEVEPSALAIGAVNTVVNREGRLFGYNTDQYGLEALLRRTGICVGGKKVMITGSGGTARTAKAVVSRLGAEQIVCVSRAPGEGSVSYAEAEAAHGDSGIIINATPVGMYPRLVGQSLLHLAKFHDLHGVIDAVYNPLRSALVQEAQQRGIPAAGGLFMLTSQAAEAVRLFTGGTLPEGRAEDCYRRILADTRNIVLIGMPGCGKSTVGRALAKLTGKPLLDTDALTEKEAGMTCRELITLRGEAAFREAERRVIQSLAPLTGHILATGGGSILDPANVADLKGNGVLVFLDRSPDALPVDESRPLAASRPAIEQLYRSRLPLYRQAADISLCPGADAESTAAMILKEVLL